MVHGINLMKMMIMMRIKRMIMTLMKMIPKLRGICPHSARDQPGGDDPYDEDHDNDEEDDIDEDDDNEDDHEGDN